MHRRVCPNCDRVLVNSPGPTCSWCGHALPPELQLSHQQAEADYAHDQEQLAHDQRLDDIQDDARTGFFRASPNGLRLAALPSALRKFRRWWNNPTRKL